MNTEQGTPTECAETVAMLAKESFAKHKIEAKGPGEWTCGRPGSGMYHFRIILRPGMLVFWGDLGEAVLRFNDHDALRWLRDAIRSPDYLFEKVQAFGRRETFYTGLALEVAKESEDKEFDEAVQLIFADDDLCQNTWEMACSEHDMDSDTYSSPIGPSARMFWMLEALRWFVANVEAQVVTP